MKRFRAQLTNGGSFSAGPEMVYDEAGDPVLDRNGRPKLTGSQLLFIGSTPRVVSEVIAKQLAHYGCFTLVEVNEEQELAQAQAADAGKPLTQGAARSILKDVVLELLQGEVSPGISSAQTATGAYRTDAAGKPSISETQLLNLLGLKKEPDSAKDARIAELEEKLAMAEANGALGSEDGSEDLESEQTEDPTAKARAAKAAKKAAKEAEEAEAAKAAEAADAAGAAEATKNAIPVI